MKILVIGAGAVGRVLCEMLAGEKDIEVVVCDDIKKAVFSNKKIKSYVSDVIEKKQFSRFLSRISPSLLINAATPLLNLRLLRICKDNQIGYMDLASCWFPDKNRKAKSPYKIEQLDYDLAFKNMGITGLIDAGVTPGMDNILAKDASEHLDSVESIKIRLYDYSGTDDLVFSWSKEALLDEINSNPLVYENNKFRIAEPFSGEEEFDFPYFGKRKVNLICQDEIGTLPFYIKTKNLDIKDYDNQIDIQKFLVELGLTSTDKITVNNIEIAPIDFLLKILPDVTLDFSDAKFNNAQFAMVVQAEGEKDGKKRTARYFAVFPKQREINKFKFKANFISYPTAISAKIFATAFRKIKQRGVFPPEALSKEIRKEIINELKKYCELKMEIIE